MSRTKSIFDPPGFPLSAVHPESGWWTEKQSPESAQWHKDRAAAKRQRKAAGKNPSNYARQNV